MYTILLRTQRTGDTGIWVSVPTADRAVTFTRARASTALAPGSRTGGPVPVGICVIVLFAAQHANHVHLYYSIESRRTRRLYVTIRIALKIEVAHEKPHDYTISVYAAAARL